MTSRFVGLSLVLAASACAVDSPYTEVASEETQLLQYDGCTALEADLKQMLIAEIETKYDQYRYWQNRSGGVYSDTNGTPAATGTASPPRVEGKDYSGTNNQEHGVDESDFVKTDGYNVYVINGNRLHIFGVPNFGDLQPEAVVSIEGWPHELLLSKDTHKAVVFSVVPSDQLPAEHPLRARIGRASPTGVWYWRVPEVSKLTVLDVSNPAAPRLEREIFLEGVYSTARLIGTSMHMSSWAFLSVPGIDYYYWYWYGNLSLDEREQAEKNAVTAASLTDMIPQVYERLPDRSFNTYSLAQQCRSFYRPLDSQARGVTSLLTIDLAAPGFKYDAKQIVSNSANIYASTKFLYVVESSHDWWWFWWNGRNDDQTNIHAFDISAPDHATYVGSGRVRGTIKDSFGLSEKDGFLRVATTVNWENRWWLPAAERRPTTNDVWVLQAYGGLLRKVGHLGDIAPGERIFASRFVGNEGYLVTFHQIDPLWTVDLSNPYAPRLQAGLVSPGVANYIQGIDEGRLLTIGYGESGDRVTWGKTMVGMFDVSNPFKPSLQSTLDLTLPTSAQWSWTWTPANYEHKAFQYFAPKAMLAVPVSSFAEWYNGNTWWWAYTSRLDLINVDPLGSLSLHGSVDHSVFYNSDPNHYWNYTDIQRSIFMGDFIYAISDRGITVHRLADLTLVTSQTLPGYLPNTWWWWW